MSLTDLGGEAAQQPEIKWSPLSSEQWREYVYPDGSTYRINNPSKLHVRNSGAHNVVDEAGVVHYVAKGWIALRWAVYPGCPFVDF
jgi:hypothetical protein